MQLFNNCIALRQREAWEVNIEPALEESLPLGLIRQQESIEPSGF